MSLTAEQSQGDEINVFGEEKNINFLIFIDSGSSGLIGPEIRCSQHQPLPLLHHQAIHKGTSTGEGGE